MEAKTFIDILKDPSAWMRKSRALRYSANAVVNSSVKTLESVPIVGGRRNPDEDAINMLVDVRSNGFYLYALSVECALKALIIEKSTQPTGHLPRGAYGFHFSDFIEEVLDEIDAAFQEAQEDQDAPKDL